MMAAMILSGLAVHLKGHWVSVDLGDEPVDSGL
jgi:hypothetical protein